MEWKIITLGIIAVLGIVFMIVLWARKKIKYPCSMDKNIKDYLETNGIPLTEDKIQEFHEAAYRYIKSIKKLI